MENQFKNYQPSSEEIEKAKEMMTRKEKKMSEMRERILSDGLLKSLEEGKYDLKIKGNIVEDIKAGKHVSGDSVNLYGTIRGDEQPYPISHYIDLEVFTGIYGNGISGKIDGREIITDEEKKVAREIFNKYVKVAHLQNQKVFEERAKEEIYLEDTKEIREAEQREREKEREKEADALYKKNRKKREEKEANEAAMRKNLKSIL